MLEIVGLEKSFGGRAILNGVNLEVSTGECVALLGSNGSGKTTTLRCTAGLAIPDRGAIRIDGIDALASGREARRRMSFLPQKSVFPATLTVKEAIELSGRLRNLPKARIGEELETCDLLTCADSSVATLSGGERQRLGLAIAFLPDVPLYLFDEPTANLDSRSLEIFLRRVESLRSRGSTVLFTTHVASDVESLATRVEVLSDGRLRPPGAERFATPAGSRR
jgi:ABC-2 type transport system ATP-binding protein